MLKFRRSGMKIRFWGVRGSLATPLSNSGLKEKITASLKMGLQAGLSDKGDVDRFFETLPPHIRLTAGGNTTCVEIMAGDTCLIMDGGTGLRPLGIDLLQRAGNKPVEAHILISHTHWDHICGIPFFNPAFVPANSVTVYGSHPDLENRIRQQQAYEFFPVPLAPAFRFVQLERETGISTAKFTIGPVSVETIPLNHPGGCYGYRVSHEGKTVVFATDSEYKDPSSEALKPYVSFFKDADAVIFDAQYSLEENVEKEDWGHSNIFTGIDMALEAGAKHLFFTHHDPVNKDARLWDNLRQAKEYLSVQGADNKLQIELAVEGPYVNV
jgi:phosphoribosyl 1,2-cyclic phosphodiesterase